MTISAELKERYRTEVDVDWRAAFVLQHPSAPTTFLIDHSEPYEGLFNGFMETFQPVPTKIVLPTKDDSGRQDLGIAFCGIGREAKAFLDAAVSNPLVPITVSFSIFILGSTAAQIDPWVEFFLTDISITTSVVTATASRADIINRQFPTEVYRLDTYPGLRR